MDSFFEIFTGEHLLVFWIVVIFGYLVFAWYYGYYLPGRTPRSYDEWIESEQRLDLLAREGNYCHLYGDDFDN